MYVVSLNLTFSRRVLGMKTAVTFNFVFYLFVKHSRIIALAGSCKFEQKVQFILGYNSSITIQFFAPLCDILYNVVTS
jgi:hypothetical protein